MGDSRTAFIIEELFDRDNLLAQRQWDLLREGVFISQVYKSGDQGASAAFLHYLAGASVPSHKHMGFEHILILHGSQEDGNRVYKEGTLVIHPPDTHHQIISREGCIALGVWEKPVEFR